MMRSIVLGVALLLAVPAPAQTVQSGIEAWQNGDHQAAVAAWTPLAARGDADAAFNLGQAYRMGKGVAMDHGRAQQYFEQAARKGHVEAASTLGILLFQNNDRSAAMRWLRKATDAGDARAMLIYGTALYNGDGLASDPVTAYAYVSRSAAQGLDIAKATLADLDQIMSLEQRQKGVVLARTMVAARTPPTAQKPATAPTPPAAPKPLTVARARPPMVAAKPAIAPARAAMATAPSRASGGWRIQLGAFGQRATAEALFAKLRGKVGARQATYVAAGKVVRLQVGPYESRAAAAAGCAALGAQACFAVAAR